MNFRQVHLDFHTSEHIEGIGSKFSKEQFQAALKAGHVNSITVFAKCHHGWAYFPSETCEMHPNLNFDLLGAEIEAAHEIGVKTPVYISAGLDEKMARRHPEWLFRNSDESLSWVKDFKTPGYHRYCMNSPYLDYLLAQIEEVVQKYDCDGIFLDIVGAFPCHCQHCTKIMLDRGEDPYDDDNAYNLGVETYLMYTRRVREAIDKYKPGLPVFHNAGHLPCGHKDFAYANTHLELESLPTGGWGYDHFPMCAAYARTLGMNFLGMTGKFHLSWGEFGGFKHPNALKYEMALSAACGAKMSIGDQMHPTGLMDMATYKLIGEAYSEVEKKEPWLDGVESVADIGLLSQEAIFYKQNPRKDPPGRFTWLGTTGANRMLLEGKYLFDIVDADSEYDKYKVIILTDNTRLDADTEARLRRFVDRGGKVLTSGEAGLRLGEDTFAFDVGAEYVGKCECCPAYIRPEFEMDNLYSSAYVIYEPSSEVTATGDVLAYRENSYFNRTTFYFSSHKQTPNDPESKFPSVTVGKEGAYVSFNIFSEYAETGSLVSKRIIEHLLDMLLGEEKTITTNLGAQGIITLMNQSSERRYVNHLLYASPIKRGRRTEVIEDLLPIYDTEVSIALETTPKRVYLAPQMTDIPFDYSDGILTYTLDKFCCHQMVVIDY